MSTAQNDPNQATGPYDVGFTGRFAGDDPPGGSAARTSVAASPSPRRRRRSWAGFSLLAFPIGFCVLFFGGSWLLSPDPDIEPADGPVIVHTDDSTVAVVAYSRDGAKGMFQLMTGAMFQSRLAAYDTETGERLWDVKLNDELVSDLRVLAAGEGRVYVASDEGLYIRSLDDGSSVAQPDAIAGLGDSYVAQLGSYEYDAVRRIVLAIDTGGTLHSIPLGADAASAATDEVAAAWQPILADTFRFALDLPTTATSALLPDGRFIQTGPTASGATSETLLTSTEQYADGAAIGDAVFFSGSIVLDATRGPNGVSVSGGLSADSSDAVVCDWFGQAPGCDLSALPADMVDAIRESGAEGSLQLPDEGMAVGASSGYALVAHQTTANGDEYAVSSISLETGSVIGTVPTGYTVTGGAMYEGTTVVTAEGSDSSGSAGVIVVADATGELASFELGAVNFFGMPW